MKQNVTQSQDGQGRLQEIWQNLSTQTTFKIGLLFFLALILVAVLAPFLVWHNPTEVNLNLRLQAPSSDFWFGTDALGRDIFGRLIFGVRTTLYVVALVTFFTTPLGVLIGILSGYAGGWVDKLLMRLTDIFLALPRLILALAFVAAMGPGFLNLIMAMVLTSWTGYARIARAETLTAREETFVVGVRLQGAGTLYILWHHILPLCLPSIIVRVTYDMAGVILMAAGFGFLGLGVQPPTPEWGSMVSSGQAYLLTHWWISMVPGTAIFLTSLIFNLMGDDLRAAIDPKLNQGNKA